MDRGPYEKDGPDQHCQCCGREVLLWSNKLRKPNDLSYSGNYGAHSLKYLPPFIFLDRQLTGFNAWEGSRSQRGLFTAPFEKSESSSHRSTLPQRDSLWDLTSGRHSKRGVCSWFSTPALHPPVPPKLNLSLSASTRHLPCCFRYHREIILGAKASIESGEPKEIPKGKLVSKKISKENLFCVCEKSLV